MAQLLLLHLHLAAKGGIDDNEQIGYHIPETMKTKYIFYLILMLVMHYEVSRLIESNQQMESNLQKDTEDSSYQKDTGLSIVSHKAKLRHKLHFVKLHDHKGKELILSINKAF